MAGATEFDKGYGLERCRVQVYPLLHPVADWQSELRADPDCHKQSRKGDCLPDKSLEYSEKQSHPQADKYNYVEYCHKPVSQFVQFQSAKLVKILIFAVSISTHCAK